jgi:hypothetical protein
VPEFRSFTSKLHRLTDRLARCGVKNVTTESTGAYGFRLTRDPSHWPPISTMRVVLGIKIMPKGRDRSQSPRFAFETSIRV